MSQTNRVVRHKTNARKNYTKPLREVVVAYEHDGHVQTARYQAESLRAALHVHAEMLDIPTDERVIVGNVMTARAWPGTFVAVEV